MPVVLVEEENVEVEVENVRVEVERLEEVGHLLGCVLGISMSLRVFLSLVVSILCSVQNGCMVWCEMGGDTLLNFVA